MTTKLRYFPVSHTPLSVLGTMEIWFFILVSLSLSALLKALLNLFLPYTTSNPKTQNLPPGPPTFPIISNILWLRKPFSELEPFIRSLHHKLGPMITLRIGSRPSIFISDRSLAYKALVQNGAVFANRPSAGATTKILSSNQHNISSSFYGPTWRLLRRNLTAEILHPSRVKSYTHARRWVLQILINQFELASRSEDDVHVVDHLQFAMFCLLVLMCFGDKLEEKTIKEIEEVQRQMLLNLTKFNILNFWPRLSKIVLHKRWAEFLQLRKNQEDVLIPLIRARKKLKEEIRLNESNIKDYHNEYVLSYVDTLLDLQLPEENRKLNEDEIISLSNEFLNAGTDTTTTALQWIMANLVKYPEIQDKLFLQIKGIVGEEKEEVNEDDVQKMPYLKAIILEGLRRHPPGHLVVPHAVSEDTVLGDYVIPKNANINFMVADMGWDPKVWEDPMAFKPERFLKDGVESFDITGSREIKMMPFGVGRRICPGLGLAMLHLEYFVGNLVWKFEWKAVDGDPVDLSEKQEFTMVMKNPLRVHISPRSRIKVGL